MNHKHPKNFNYRHIVDNFALIDEDDILKVNFSNLNNEASFAMFHALMASCTKQMRDCLNMYATNISMQGPPALWYILKILTSRNTLILKEFQTELANLGDLLPERNYDLIKIAPKLHRKIMDYIEARGPTFTIYDQVMSTLRTIPCQPFVQELQLYEVDQKANLKQQGMKDPSINPLDLLQKIPEMIKTLDATNQWPFHMGGKPRGGKRKNGSKDGAANKKPKGDDPDDMTAFRAEIDTLKSTVTLMKKGNGTNPPPPPPSSKAPSRPNDKYKFTNHWGPNCHYKQEEHLKQFINGACTKDTVEMPPGTIWRWCEQCSRMGSHDTAHHRPTKRKSHSNKTVEVIRKPPLPPPLKSPSASETQLPPSPPPTPQANTATVFAVGDDGDVEVEDFRADCP